METWQRLKQRTLFWVLVMGLTILALEPLGATLSHQLSGAVQNTAQTSHQVTRVAVNWNNSPVPVDPPSQ